MRDTGASADVRYAGQMWKAAATTALVGAMALPALGATPAPRLTARGNITALTPHKIVVRNVHRRVVCFVGEGSPDLTPYSVGDLVALACAGHPPTLVRNAPVTTADSGAAPTGGPTGEPTGDQHPAGETTTFGGVVTVLAGSSITVHDGTRDLTCTLGTGSPSLVGVAVGDHVYVACAGGVLLVIAKPHSGGETTTTTTTTSEPPPSTTTTSHTTRGALGTVSALSTAAVSVQTDGGVVTCSFGPSSPSAAEVHVGDRVKMYCLDGVVAVLAHVS